MIVFDRKEPPRSIEVNTSQQLHIGPALIVSLQIAEEGSKGSAIVYDGGNANGTRKATLRAVQNYCFSPYISGGIMCSTGIYVAVNDENTYLRIEYIPGLVLDGQG